MDDSRKEHVERIHAQISQDGYQVDASAVADAILRRLLEGRSLKD
jgi:anti-sigma28 factor (negative regulator of flagellin synthesis)